MSGQRDPEQVAADSVAAMYATDAASQHLGVTIEGVAPGRATARMTVAPTMVNGHGIAHGGYVFLLADTAFAFACNTYGDRTVARQCEITFLRPVSDGDELLAEAIERYRRGRSGIYDVQVRRGEDVVAELRGHSATTNAETGS